jgi:signal transduction histidine kinase
VAAGVARGAGLDVTVVRIGFVLAAIFGGLGVAVYLALWLLLPMEGQTTSIAARAASDRRGILLSLAFLPALVATTAVLEAIHVGVFPSFTWPVFVSAAAALLIWRNCDPEERAWIRQALEPVVQLGARPVHRRRRAVLRLGLGVLLGAVGLTLVVVSQRPPAVSILRPMAGAVLVLAGMVVIFGPWWLRLAREVIEERQARLRAEERADMAARVHDSVLQTLALIQRAAGEPERVVQLARAQERELRAWLFDGELPASKADGAPSIAVGIRQIAAEVEADHRVAVDVVTVGDRPLDDRLRAVLAAAQEATVNAAKWSGASTVSLYAEVEPAKVSVFVRDRGRGFDPDRVPEDRRGIAHSIQARMLRIGGVAVVRTAPGQGTEVELSVRTGEHR